MSIESAKAFIERMKSDQEFAKKVQAHTNLDDALAFIASEGYTLNPKELHAATDLDDDDLERVSGGGSYCKLQTLNHQPACDIFLWDEVSRKIGYCDKIFGG